MTGSGGAGGRGSDSSGASGLSDTATGGGDSNAEPYFAGNGAGSAGGDGKGGPYSGGNGGDEAIGGSGGDNLVVDNAAGAAGAAEPGPEHGGWLAYDLDLFTAFGERQIQILRADGSCERELIWATDGGKIAKQPAFSADGKQIAFVADSTGIFQVYVMDLASGERTKITNEADGATYPSWSPNGKSIAYVIGDPEDKYDRTHPLDGTTNTVMLVDTTTRQTVTLTSGHPAYGSSAFASNNLLLVGNSISVIGIQTDTLAKYNAAPETAMATALSSPSISPDGSRFVVSGGCGTQNQLLLARVDGTTGDTCSKATPLAANSDGLITASWGPAGYIAAETSHHDIVLVPSDGSLGIKVLVNSPQPERNPAFAPTSVALDCTK
jgi:dipeptidyl aminopeptidase/acylaminoacyl peptidase